MVLAGLAVPWLGALSDRTGKTKAYLILTTFLCVSFTAFLSLFAQAWTLIIVFLLACFFFHASLVFYYALLPTVAEPEKQGSTSGIGTALGYLGVVFSIPVAHMVDFAFGRRFVFLAAAILFLIFAIPLFLWVPERKVARPLSPAFGLAMEEWKEVLKTLGKIVKSRPLRFFFLGNYLVIEAINTVIFWLVIYLARVFNPPQIYLVALFLGLNFSAFLFGLAAGSLTDRFGARKIFLAAATSLFITLIILGTTKNFWIFTALGLTGGAFSLAGTWTAARKWVVELAPKEAVGEYFGLYNLTTKISVAGSLLFSVLADRFGFEAALLSQTVPSGLGLLFLWLAGRRPAIY